MRQLAPIVFVVDDDASMRDSVRSLIHVAGLRVKCFASSAEFLCYPETFAPSCLVLDVRMPDLSGPELQHELKRKGRHVPIIFITAHGDIPTAVQVLKAGAVEFLSKPFRDLQLLSAIRRAIDQDRAAKKYEAELAQIRQQRDRLTPREREVLAYVLVGSRNKRIATNLGLSVNTIKVHRHRIMQKMSVSSIAELVRMVVKLG